MPKNLTPNLKQQALVHLQEQQAFVRFVFMCDFVLFYCHRADS